MAVGMTWPEVAGGFYYHLRSDAARPPGRGLRGCGMSLRREDHLGFPRKSTVRSLRADDLYIKNAFEELKESFNSIHILCIYVHIIGNRFLTLLVKKEMFI